LVNASWSPHLYRRQGLALGVPDEVLSAAIEATEKVLAISRELAPVLTLAHLARLSNVRYKFLRQIVTRRTIAYDVFNIKKRGPGAVALREIAVPYGELRIAQAWISANVLAKVSPDPHSFAYHPGSSVLGCAQRHSACRWLIKIDVRSFFPSISERKVFELFEGLGYSRLLSFEMARLCTIISQSDTGHDLNKQLPSEQQRDLPYVRARQGYLPTGAPTSPMISNLVMKRFDEEVARLCATRGASYTRYADDILISTSEERFSRESATRIARDVKSLLRNNGFSSNENKLAIIPPGARKIVLGLIVNSQRPHVSRRFKSRLRQHYYYIGRFGVTGHSTHRRFASVAALERHLLGLIAYANQTDPAFASKMRRVHCLIDWPGIVC
jgi:RNA-directed DNA polymerase